jgi:hypothetical protein
MAAERANTSSLDLHLDAAGDGEEEEGIQEMVSAGSSSRCLWASLLCPG